MTEHFPTIESTKAPLFEHGRTFHPFPRLPTELRHLIWSSYIESTDPVVFNLYYNARDDGYNGYKIPVALQVCRESREAGLKHWLPFNDDPNDEANGELPEDGDEDSEDELQPPFRGKLVKEHAWSSWSGQPYNYYFAPDKDVLFYIPDGHDCGYKGWAEQGGYSAFPKLSRKVKTLAIPAPFISALLVGGDMWELPEQTKEGFRKMLPAVEKLLIMEDPVQRDEEDSDEEMFDEDEDEEADEYAHGRELGFGWTHFYYLGKEAGDEHWVREQTGMKKEVLEKKCGEYGVEFEFVQPVNCFTEAELREKVLEFAEFMARGGVEDDDDEDEDEDDDDEDDDEEDDENYDADPKKQRTTNDLIDEDEKREDENLKKLSTLTKDKFDAMSREEFDAMFRSAGAAVLRSLERGEEPDLGVFSGSPGKESKEAKEDKDVKESKDVGYKVAADDDDDSMDDDDDHFCGCGRPHWTG